MLINTANISHPSHSKSQMLGGIREGVCEGAVTLGPTAEKGRRRILFINSYGGREAWEKVKAGVYPPHHLWGCIELARMGYEVAIAPPIRHFEFRRPLPHDLPLLKLIRTWLRTDDILYCGHTLLYWTPLLLSLIGPKCRIVSLTYAREELDFAKLHHGIIALTPSAEAQARKIAPRAKVAHLGWGVDLSFFPLLPYQPQWFLSCGRTHRDHLTLALAAQQTRASIRVVSQLPPSNAPWPPNVTMTTAGNADDTVSYNDLLYSYYQFSAGSLIILLADPEEKTAVGFTNLIEAMAMARPVIVTRTGALPAELDVERAGCGIHVPADDATSLARAIDRISGNPSEAEAMGANGRALCESHYNIQRFATRLHQFFEGL